MTLDHGNSIDWPNGLGFTVCTDEYAATKRERDAICNPNGREGGNLGDLSAEDYQKWNVLDDKLHQLQLAGHLGGSIRL